ncbi:hypothetical protein Tco_1129064 [Tanacetum coccineum]
MAAAGDLDEIKEVNANFILMENLQQPSTSGAVSELLEPIPEPHRVQQNDSNIIPAVSSVEQDGGTVEQHHATVKETRAYFESLYYNLAIKVEKVNSVNSKLRETNADLTTKLAKYKNQEECFEISQEKYDKLERCYQKSLSKEKSTVSSLQEEKKKLKSDFKIHEDELLDKQIQLENKIKKLDNILVKTEIHKIVKDEIFPIVNQVDAIVQNFKIQFLKEAAKFVRDFKFHTNEADESLAKHKALELEIERLLRAIVSQDIMSIMLNPPVVETSYVQTELERTKE